MPTVFEEDGGPKRIHANGSEMSLTFNMLFTANSISTVSHNSGKCSFMVCFKSLYLDTRPSFHSMYELIGLGKHSSTTAGHFLEISNTNPSFSSISSVCLSKLSRRLTIDLSKLLKSIIDLMT